MCAKSGEVPERYKCQSCEMISIPKHGSLFIVIMPLVVWPVIHVLLSLSLGALLYWLLGDMEIGGWELSEIIIFVLSALVALIVMIKVNVLEPLRKG